MAAVFLLILIAVGIPWEAFEIFSYIGCHGVIMILFSAGSEDIRKLSFFIQIFLGQPKDILVCPEMCIRDRLEPICMNAGFRKPKSCCCRQNCPLMKWLSGWDMIIFPIFPIYSGKGPVFLRTSTGKILSLPGKNGEEPNELVKAVGKHVGNA